MYQTAHNTVLESHKIQDFQRVGHMSVTWSVGQPRDVSEPSPQQGAGVAQNTRFLPGRSYVSHVICRTTTWCIRPKLTTRCWSLTKYKIPSGWVKCQIDISCLWRSAKKYIRSLINEKCPKRLFVDFLSLRTGNLCKDLA